MMFWMENILFVSAFLVFELCLGPFVWIGCMINIIYCTNGMFTTVYNTFKWCLLGLLYLAFILIKDVYNLLKILCMHRGCREAKNLSSGIDLDEVERKKLLKIDCFNSIRGVVISMYREIIWQLKED